MEPTTRIDRSRGELARWWAIFVLLWCGAVIVIGFSFHHLACNAENGGPEPGSAKASYCAGIDNYLKSGEPSEWTTPLPYLLPIALLATIGGYGVWRRSRRLVSGAAIIAVAALVGHLIMLVVLPG